MSAQKPRSTRTPGLETKLVFVSSNLASLEEAPMWNGLGDSYAVTKAGLGMYVAPLRCPGVACMASYDIVQASP